MDKNKRVPSYRDSNILKYEFYLDVLLIDFTKVCKKIYKKYFV